MGSQTTTRSQQYFEHATQLMPGGVNSPVRAFRNVGGTPLFIERAQGPYVWDVDGKQYIDYVGSWGPMIVGHAHPNVINRVKALADKGLSFGAPSLLENELAELVINAIPSIGMVRFVSTGTEAVMSAIRLARAATGRAKILKFVGCYHGHADALLVKAGSGAATHGSPDSAGVPNSQAELTILAPFNDLAAVERICTEHGLDLAAILVEPVAGNMGCIPPTDGFLQGLRSLATKTGALLIFDEVMTGFRVAYGGAQAYYGIQPDITCLGKIVGGGLPAAAYGASKDIMKWVSPLGSMYQAGTLSGNPLAMAAGIETLKLLQVPNTYDTLTQLTQQMAQGLQAISRSKNIPITAPWVCGMFSLFFNPGPVNNYDDVCRSDKERFNRMFHRLLENGIYMAPSAFEAGFLSLAHTPELVQQTLDAIDQALD